jgi:hypothetical protein
VTGDSSDNDLSTVANVDRLVFSHCEATLAPKNRFYLSLFGSPRFAMVRRRVFLPVQILKAHGLYSHGYKNQANHDDDDHFEVVLQPVTNHESPKQALLNELMERFHRADCAQPGAGFLVHYRPGARLAGEIDAGV